MWYESMIYTTSYCTKMHRHSAWQLTASLSGTFRFRTEKEEILLPPGDWILLSPELLHDAGSDSPTSRAMQIFFRRFPHDLLPELADHFNLRRGIFRTGHGSVDGFARIAADFLQKARDADPLGKSWRSVLGLEFALTALSDLQEKTEERQAILPGIIRALEFMEEHFAEPLGVAEFAEAAGLSESRFATLFHRETGTTPMHFFNTVRLGHAQSFLLNGASVDEAAERAGFSSPQYFCRYFRKQTGFSPGAFRANPFAHGERERSS